MSIPDYNPSEVCAQIREIYPEVGECGIGVSVEYDEIKTSWIVSMTWEGHKVYTHLNPSDAKACIEGDQCLVLGSQIGQLVATAKKRARE
jgi:hypothetical protein